MSEMPADLKYTKTHEWIRIEGNEVYVGITEHAQHLLGDLVFVELPEEGDEVKPGEELAVVESVKAASDVYAPISGEILAVNRELEDAPSLVNNDPYGDGWLVKLSLADEQDLTDLLSADEYSEEVAEEEA